MNKERERVPLGVTEAARLLVACIQAGLIDVSTTPWHGIIASSLNEQGWGVMLLRQVVPRGEWSDRHEELARALVQQSERARSLRVTHLTRVEPTRVIVELVSLIETGGLVLSPASGVAA